MRKFLATLAAAAGVLAACGEESKDDKATGAVKDFAGLVASRDVEALCKIAGADGDLALQEELSTSVDPVLEDIAGRAAAAPDCKSRLNILLPRIDGKAMKENLSEPVDVDLGADRAVVKFENDDTYDLEEVNGSYRVRPTDIAAILGYPAPAGTPGSEGRSPGTALLEALKESAPDVASLLESARIEEVAGDSSLIIVGTSETAEATADLRGACSSLLDGAKAATGKNVVSALMESTMGGQVALC